MRSVNPYSDNTYDSAAGLVNPSAAAAAAAPPLPRTPPSKKSTHRAATSLGSDLSGGGPINSPPLIRANLAPLQARDPNQHVLSLTASASSTRSTTKDALIMPPSEKPRQPQLSAGAARGMHRTPLTPKVAVMAPPAGTPLTRKQTVTIANVQTPHKEELNGHQASYFSPSAANITPRSGPRQTRVDSTNSTPNGTPNPDKAGDGWDTNSRGLGLSPLGRSESFGSRKSLGESPIEPRIDNKFFYASDAKPAPLASQSRPVSVHQKNASTFFYASDASASNKRSSNPPTQSGSSTPSLGSVPDPTSKFFYANGTPDVDPRLSVQSTASGSSGSNSSKGTRPNTSNAAVGFGTPPIYSRPASPVKGVIHPPPPPSAPQQVLRSSAMTPSSPNRGPALSPPMLGPNTTQVGKRRVSIEAPSRFKKGHSRAGSVPTMNSFSAPRMGTPSLSPPEQASPPTTPETVLPAMTMASILQMAEELGEEEEEEEEDDHSGDSDSESRSAKKSSQSSDPVSHLVLSARRERKVQDLEIRNASLEAINRTLERQMRKQKAELRRFRRMSRAGRLPGSSVASSRVTSLAISEAPTDLTDVTEQDGEQDAGGEDEEEVEEEDEEEDSLDDSESSGEDPAADPTSTDSPGSKRRKREERRLQLDLTKHQELLIDSQKMNQSIKRCLDWTEELIKEGQKALAYHVRVSDVDDMPGRVLAPAYYDYRDDTSHLEDDTISTVSVSHFGDDAMSTVGSELEPWVKGPQDRDSGIELHPEGA